MQISEIRETLMDIRAGLAKVEASAEPYRLVYTISPGNPERSHFNLHLDGEETMGKRLEVFIQRAGQLLAHWRPPICGESILMGTKGEHVYYAAMIEFAASHRRYESFDGTIRSGTLFNLTRAAVTTIERLIAEAERQMLQSPADLVNAARAAEIAEVDPKTIARWIRASELPTYGPKHLISEGELRQRLPALRKRRHRGGTAREKKRARQGRSKDITRTELEH